MISILIPIYNQNIGQLVRSLTTQATELRIDFELICMDDQSNPTIKNANRILNSIQYVNYLESSEKLGRAKIRNRLSRLARYSWLLYLDCDSGVENPLFLKAYVDQIKDEEMSIEVICGGTKYQEKKPKADKILHWKYGRTRESLPARSRSRKAALHFHSNNFLVHKKLFEQISFDSSIVNYGYEDLAWAYSIIQNGYLIKHIDNPVVHLGIKSTKSYLIDLKSAMANLSMLYDQRKIPQSRLTTIYNLLKSWGLLSALMFFVSLLESSLISHVSRSNPKLWVLDLMKLFYFSQHRTKHI